MEVFPASSSKVFFLSRTLGLPISAVPSTPSHYSSLVSAHSRGKPTPNCTKFFKPSTAFPFILFPLPSTACTSIRSRGLLPSGGRDLEGGRRVETSLEAAAAASKFRQREEASGVIVRPVDYSFVYIHFGYKGI
ncbi:hypothetical protein M5K25_015763 [Dendrobium thyrsiflorum]|uniref:Uncharacterized protein n=1 Tax=Dendrobium thyrsiflorum TaxID=117978 RepID=A0ABD0UY19_DENTH